MHSVSVKLAYLSHKVHDLLLVELAYSFSYINFSEKLNFWWWKFNF